MADDPSVPFSRRAKDVALVPTGRALFALIDVPVKDVAVELVAAVPGKRIKVLGYVASGSNTGSFQFRSDTDPITGVLSCLVGVAVRSAYNPDGHFQTEAGEPLTIISGSTGAIVVGGHLTYILVDETE